MGLNASSAGDIDALGFDSSNGLLFSTDGDLSASGTTITDEDVALFAGSFGSATSGTVSIAHALTTLGISAGEDLDGLHRSGGSVGTNPPTAAFSGTPLSGSAPLLVAFADQSTGSISSYAWNFGDGSSSTSQNPSHTYTSAGTYTVSLTVTGPGGSDTSSQPNYITASNVPSSGDLLYASFTSNATIPGVGTAANEDIVAYDVANGGWSLFLDGSDVGLSSTDITAFCVMADGSVIFSINSPNFNLAGLTGGPSGSAITENDLIRFIPSSTGATTAGSFEFYLDGSDVGLDVGGDDIDGVHVDSNGLIYLSIRGHAQLTGLGWVGDEDVLLLTPSSIGATTAGTWSLHFDGSDMGLNASSTGDIDALGFDGSGGLILSTDGAHAFGATAWEDEDALLFSGSFGPSTSGSISMGFDLSVLGIPGSSDLDGLHR